jgi:hypothetical protein
MGDGVGRLKLAQRSGHGRRDAVDQADEFCDFSVTTSVSVNVLGGDRAAAASGIGSDAERHRACRDLVRANASVSQKIFGERVEGQEGRARDVPVGLLDVERECHELGEEPLERGRGEWGRVGDDT